MVLVADVPDARKDHEKYRISDDSVRYCKERNSARTKGERRNGDECVGRVKVAADKEPDDNRAKAPPAEAPFVQQVEIAFAPFGRREAPRTGPNPIGSACHSSTGISCCGLSSALSSRRSFIWRPKINLAPLLSCIS